MVSLSNGTRALVVGGSGGITGDASVVRVIAHTHPAWGGVPSAADAMALTSFKQSSSWIVHFGAPGEVQLTVVKYWAR